MFLLSEIFLMIHFNKGKNVLIERFRIDIDTVTMISHNNRTETLNYRWIRTAPTTPFIYN